MPSDATPLTQAGTTGADADRAAWWRDAVIYQVYIRSFADSDGDGVGDMGGIRQRLPHLADLGVDAVWITPFYTSPMADGGYDVADYRDVDPLFGGLEDFDAMLAEAHRLGIKVIVDLVPNHTSDQHPWFVEALAAEPGSPARERYIFRPGRGENGELPPNDWESVFGGLAWTRTTNPDGTPGEWYLHLFAPEQPDLNWRNPAVREEFADILRFWLDRGVDGFRVDVAHGMFKAEGLPDVGTTGQAEMLTTAVLPYWDQDEVHGVYREWRALLDSYPGERIFVAEAWVPNAERMARYLRADELHQAFNFAYLHAEWSAEALRAVIDDSLAATAQVGAPTTWVLSNHDVVRHVTRYGGGEQGTRRARAAALLMLGLPGSAYVYQGEELGLEEIQDLPVELIEDPRYHRTNGEDPGRDGCRVPLPWSGTAAPFGFGPEGLEKAWLPAPARWAALTVEAQREDPASMLSLYREALRLRRQWGGGELLNWLPSPEGVLTFSRETGLEVTVNVTDKDVELPAPGEVLLASAPVEVTGGVARIPAETAVWWRGAGA
ncbi:glycoside hydrolase family 13 protein [Allostreptomyces psammosilenae]|uniref:glycoside hydrolase family 13 protein n=1 Tax=Allostreptomyces psammosilenae TaxID=1892865 RepID=UPI001FE7BDD6